MLQVAELVCFSPQNPRKRRCKDACSTYLKGKSHKPHKLGTDLQQGLSDTTTNHSDARDNDLHSLQTMEAAQPCKKHCSVMEVVTRMWNDGRLATPPKLGALNTMVWTPQLTLNSVALFWSFSVFSFYFETFSQNMLHNESTMKFPYFRMTDHKSKCSICVIHHTIINLIHPPYHHSLTIPFDSSTMPSFFNHTIWFIHHTIIL